MPGPKGTAGPREWWAQVQPTEDGQYVDITAATRTRGWPQTRVLVTSLVWGQCVAPAETSAALEWSAIDRLERFVEALRGKCPETLSENSRAEVSRFAIAWSASGEAKSLAPFVAILVSNGEGEPGDLFLVSAEEADHAEKEMSSSRKSKESEGGSAS